MEIKALIIDDEPLARNVISQYANKIESLKIICSCENAMQAFDVLNKEAIDLIFLDINMPDLSGISFLKSLKHPPTVIFTTAYTEYALEGFELDAIDYLKKPFSFERFLKAVNKASEQLKLKISLVSAKDTSADTEKEEYIFVKANKKTYKIYYRDIMFIEGLGDYIKIHLKDRHIVTNLTMKKIQDILPEKKFFRIHKSFIIAVQPVELIEGNMVMINKTKIPIGNSYRQDFFKIVNQRVV